MACGIQIMPPSSLLASRLELGGHILSWPYCIYLIRIALMMCKPGLVLSPET